MNQPFAWYRPMISRSSDEEHRVATPLELFFDLCFVVAVSFAAVELRNALSEPGGLDVAIGSYVIVFFAIWWAWMNFTWFASAFDTDDGIYRLTTFVQITGALVLAAGIPHAFEQDTKIVVVGYVIMRLAMVAQWLRAAQANTDLRATATKYAIGITVVQVLWVLRLLVPDTYFVPSFVTLVIAELLVPTWAERNKTTTFHPHHITERYGLFTIIVLGEAILGVTTAVEHALDAGRGLSNVLPVAFAGLVMVLSIWWLYFANSHEATADPKSLRTSIVWGYGHYFIFAAVASIGSALEVIVGRTSAHEPWLDAPALALGIAVTVLIISLWAIGVTRKGHTSFTHVLAFVAAAISLAAAFTHHPAEIIAVTLAATAAFSHFGRQAAQSG